MDDRGVWALQADCQGSLPHDRVLRASWSGGDIATALADVDVDDAAPLGDGSLVVTTVAADRQPPRVIRLLPDGKPGDAWALTGDTDVYGVPTARASDGALLGHASSAEEDALGALLLLRPGAPPALVRTVDDARRLCAATPARAACAGSRVAHDATAIAADGTHFFSVSPLGVLEHDSHGHFEGAAAFP